MLLKFTSTCIMSADLGRGGDLHLDINSNNLPEDSPIEPKHIGNKKNWFISIFMECSILVFNCTGILIFVWRVMIKNTTCMASLLTTEI